MIKSLKLVLLLSFVSISFAGCTSSGKQTSKNEMRYEVQGFTFEQYDDNKDGSIVYAEATKRFQKSFDIMDLNKDGKVTEKEHDKVGMSALMHLGKKDNLTSDQ